MKRFLGSLAFVVLAGGVIYLLAGLTAYPDQALSGGFQAGHFDDVYDLTAGDITISFTYDANGLVDDPGAHAWAELGVRSLGTGSDFNPYWRYPVKTVDLMAGQTYDTGDLRVWRSGSVLYVTYISTDCPFTETHLAVATSLAGIPQTKKNNPVPGQFPYAQMHDPAVSEYTYEIPFSTSDPANPNYWPENSTLYIAAHAVVSCPGGGTETAWAGSLEFDGKNWAKYTTYILTGEAGSGVWLATDYDWTANTFDPDPVGAPNLDLDDKLILQRQGGQGEGAYDLPSAPPSPGNNHRVWFDRDGVDPWQYDALYDGKTFNTSGIYVIIITLHATGPTTGTAYMTINGLSQGFETDGNWDTIELTPAGMTFVGDMKNLVVFYGLYGYGATQGAMFKNITVAQ